MFALHFGKSITVFGFICFASSFLVYARRKNFLPFRTTGVENTHLTLAVISFQVGVNDFLYFIAITDIRKKICCESPFL